MKQKIRRAFSKYYLNLGLICMLLQIIFSRFLPTLLVTDFFSGFFTGLGIVFLIAALFGRFIISRQSKQAE